MICRVSSFMKNVDDATIAKTKNQPMHDVARIMLCGQRVINRRQLYIDKYFLKNAFS